VIEEYSIICEITIADRQNGQTGFHQGHGDGNGCHNAVKHKEYQESREDAYPHMRIHGVHVGIVVPIEIEHEKSRVQSEDEHQVAEYKPPIATLEEKIRAK
jgi:hypothetical protein